MAVRISFPPFSLVATLILCFAAVSLSSTFADHNPIRVVSDGPSGFRSSDALPIIDDHAPLSMRRKIEAIYQFGDSMADTGNYIREHPQSHYAKSPYGQTFFHKPTGRCSNGLLIIDYFSKFLKLPFLDPYHNKDGNFSHGVNFAVAASTAINCSTLAMKGIKECPTNSSLLVQLDWFKSHLDSICSTASECKEKLAKALIVMGEIGGNDYNWAFFQGNPIREIYKMVPEVVQVIKKAIKEVINLGAVRIIVPGNFPIGCMTIYLDMFKTNDTSMYDEFQCLEYLNTFAEFHNNKLQQVIGEVQEDHPDVTIAYADYYLALREILQNASSLGFDKDVMQLDCCANCARQGGSVCRHPYKYVNWDEVHFTQHAYKIIAEWLIEHLKVVFS